MRIDLIILLFIPLVIYRSRHSGFVRQLFASIGLFGGLLVGRWLTPYALHHVDTLNERAFLAVITLLGISLVGLSLGEIIGLLIKHRYVNQLKLNKLDNIMGGAVTGTTLLLCCWLLAVGASRVPELGLQEQVAESKIVRSLNTVLPPAPNVLADISRLINPNSFPDVFIGNEPIPRTDVNLPALGSLADAVTLTRDSVVRIEGQGCGSIVTGSGFVIGEDLIATNAHVVAGIKNPYVQDVGGTHKGTVVVFDPKLDFAIIRVNDLAGSPIPLNTATVKSGTPAVVLGYPGGGNLAAGPAAVTSKLKASGHDIYGKGRTVRTIYEIKATIESGNSGGPLIDVEGKVIGVIFAESTSADQIGYALTTESITKYLEQAANRQQAVPVGKCTG
jgi:S1-C subfamily serine protease